MAVLGFSNLAKLSNIQRSGDKIMIRVIPTIVILMSIWKYKWKKGAEEFSIVTS